MIFKKRKKTKKGFTLFELLATIIIISLIVVIGVPVYQTTTKRTKQKMLDIKMDTANQSGKLWAQDNIDCFKSDTCLDKISPVDCNEEGNDEDSECFLISLDTLAKEGYYNYDDDNKNIINPTDNSLINDRVVVLVYNNKSNKVSNHPIKTYRYKVVKFDNLKDQTQNHIITIDNLADIDFIKSDTGTVTYNKNKDNITLIFNDGEPTSSEWNPNLYSKEVTASRTSSSNTFGSTYNYFEDGYEGVLSKSGGSTIISGSYAEEDTKYVTAQDSPNYDSEGYKGTLSIYVYSGSAASSDSFMAYKTLYKSFYDVTCWIGNCVYGNCLPTSYYYNSGGYSGTLTRPSGAAYVDWTDDNYYLPPGKTEDYGRCDQHYSTTLSGIVTKPGYDTRVWKYRGYVTREGYDTRVWQQNYSGTAYKGGDDSLYSYTATIAYNVKK